MIIFKKQFENIKGNFTEDQFDGYGEFYWDNGNVYKGNWTNGKMNG